MPGTPVTYLRGSASLTYGFAPAIPDSLAYAEHTDIWASGAGGGSPIITLPLLEGGGSAVFTAYGGNASIYLDGVNQGTIVGANTAGGTFTVNYGAGPHVVDVRSPVDVGPSFAFAKVIVTPTTDPVAGTRIALRQSIVADNSLSPAVPVLPLAALSGSLLVAQGCCRASAGPLSMSDNAGGAWTDNPFGSLVVNAADAMGVMYKRAVGGEKTFTSFWGGTNGRNRVVISEWTTPGGFALDGSAQASNTSPYFRMGQVTPSLGPTLLIGYNVTGNFDSALVLGHPAGWVDLDNVQQAGDFHPHSWSTYRLVDVPSGAYEPASYQGSGIVNKGILLAFRGIGGGSFAGEPGGGVW